MYYKRVKLCRWRGCRLVDLAPSSRRSCTKKKFTKEQKLLIDPYQYLSLRWIRIEYIEKIKIINENFLHSYKRQCAVSAAQRAYFKLGWERERHTLNFSQSWSKLRVTFQVDFHSLRVYRVNMVKTNEKIKNLSADICIDACSVKTFVMYNSCLTVYILLF